MTEPTLLPIEEESGTTQTAVPGPGQRLREERESQKLSVSKVADLLHLDPRLVGALEHNDYEHLPEPIYVTGYLRNYARLLDIPEEEVVSSYQQLDIPPPPILSDLTRKTQHQAPLNHMLIQWGAVGLVGIALVLVTWHMNTRPPAPDKPAGPPAAAMVPGHASAVKHAADAVGTAKDDADTRVASSAADVSAAVDDAGGTARRSAPAAQAAASPPPSVAAPVPEAAAAPAAGPGTDAAPGPDHGSAAVSGGSLQTAAADAATVVLRFDHDSWVEMTDAGGQRVFFDLGKAGQTRTVHGMPPFKVLLGYSPGVSIEYNGKPFDQSAYTGHNNVARFTMGGGH